MALVLLTSTTALGTPGGRQPGEPDPEFGDNGVVTVAYEPVAGYDLRGGEVAPHRTGAVWVLATDLHAFTQSDAMAVIMRYRTSGKLDAGFGDGGQRTWRFRHSGESPATFPLEVAAVGDAVQVSGFWTDLRSDQRPFRFIVRFAADGALDFRSARPSAAAPSAPSKT